MKPYFCPSCGEEIKNDFKVSVGGLFNAVEDNKNNFYTELAFLEEGSVVLDKDKIQKCGSLQELNDLSDEFVEENMPSDAEKSFLKQSVGFDLEDDSDASQREANEIKYLWIHTLVNKIRVAVENDNPIVHHLISVSDPQERDKWYEIDLKKCFNPKSKNEIFLNLKKLVDLRSLVDFGEKTDEIIDILDTADICIMKCNYRYIKAHYDSDDEKRYHLTDLKYGDVNAYKRICPKCAASISPYFGLYPQKIISFIGTPTSGKSTVIVALFHKLIDGTKKLQGVSTEFDHCSPFHKFYQENNRLISNKLAVKKTDKGEFPSLSLLVSSDRGKKYVYTFVDVPGEYFVDPDETRYDMHKLEIMGHSDIIYAVFAGEQFTGIEPENADRAVIAQPNDQVLEQYKLRCQSLKNSFFDDRIIPVEALISKFDSIKPDDNDYVKINDFEYWRPSDVPVNGEYKYRISKGEIDSLINQLNKPDNDYYDITNRFVRSRVLKECNELSCKLYLGNVKRTFGLLNNVISGLFALGNSPVPEKIPANFVSSFGFYALQNIDRLSLEDKKAAFHQSTVFNFSDEVIDEIIDAGKNDEADVYRKNNLTYDKVERCYIDYYLDLHAGDWPCGINAFLYNMFLKTGFLYDDTIYKRDYMLEKIANAIRKKKTDKESAERNVEKYIVELSELKGFRNRRARADKEEQISGNNRAIDNLIREIEKYESLQNDIGKIGDMKLTAEENAEIVNRYNFMFPDSQVEI